ncbi:glycosyltransferase [Cohnella faecalis]|uniref:Glycosyltransferase n=1 Tax=Cohnella faecalis TaxID=2315694 RepID=A0A398CND1_9BACL|nr:glycosyltransferase [Cohnella faecalis]RIE03822.1 glycosyltransferase [Cohnella faecalis]
MNILHVSLGLPPYRTGGLTKYSVDLMLAQREARHEVSVLYPGHFAIGSLSIKPNAEFEGIRVYEIVNPLPVSLLGGVRQPSRFYNAVERKPYEDFLSKLNPDVIHIHSLMGVHYEFFLAAKKRGIKLVFTTHDYYGICPKVNLLNRDESICNDYGDGLGCAQCNGTGYSMLKLYLMQSRTYRHLKNSPFVRKMRQREKSRQTIAASRPIAPGDRLEEEKRAPEFVRLRKYYLDILSLVDTFHFNSSIAKEEYNRHMDARGTIIPVTHRDIRDSRTVKRRANGGKLVRLAYLGPVDKYKGFFLLKESLALLSHRKDWILDVYGNSSIDSDDYDPVRFAFHGSYSYGDLSRIFDRTDLLIMPSIWKETFGFVGLEAFSYGVPVMVSEHMGFKDVVSDGETGIVFGDGAARLASELERIMDNRELLSAMNRNIVQMDFPFSMERHAAQMMELYGEMGVAGRRIV